MVKFLVIGDFNAVLKKSLIKKVEKQDFDAILALGDYGGDKRIGRAIFKHWGKNWREAIGEKRAKKLLKEDFQKAVKVLRWLNSLKKPVFFVFGNNDQDSECRQWKGSKLKNQDATYDNLRKCLKKLKNLKFIHEKTVKFKGINIYGHGGFITSDIYLTQKPASGKVERYKTRKKEYNEDKKMLLKSKIMDIFLIHYPPYGILDKINNPLVKIMHGKPVGFKPYNLAIRKFKPKIVFCSHMEEHSSKKKRYYNSLVVNPGSALLGRFAILDFDEKKKKIKNLKFFK